MKETKPYSRLIQQEQKKAVKQSVFLLGASVVIVIVFIAFGLPLFFSVFVKLFGGGASTNDNQFPPQVPVLSAPVTATSSAQLPLTGYTESEAEVTIVRNGEQLETITADEAGSFEITIQLEKGNNDIALFAKRGEQESDLSRTYTVLLDTEKPKIELQEPQENQEFQSRTQQNITVKGKTDIDAKVLLNGRTVYPSDDGTFSTTYQLQEGENVLTFIAQDEAKNETKIERKVKFKL